MEITHTGITPIDGFSISKLCDYSFGDQAGVVSNVYDSFIKNANETNKEFLDVCKKNEFVSVFIDNIRLYKRPVEVHGDWDRQWIEWLQSNNDLLKLCATLPNKFIIFSGLEDTPIDNHIQIPKNVLKIYATNALFYNKHIIPMPYGLQRKMNKDDNRLEIMQNHISYERIPDKLLYMNMGIGRNSTERRHLLRFKDCDYATVHLNEQSMYFPYNQYMLYLNEIQNHRFMLCPMGHGVDCHRNWECLYMRRVPVMRRTKYLEKLFDGYPVLFVDSYDQVNKQFLEDNMHLFSLAQTMDLNNLDLHRYYKNCIDFALNK